MKIVIEETKANVTRYACTLCDETFSRSDECAHHEWSHHSSGVRSHHEEHYGVDFTFLFFEKREQIDSFSAAFCAVVQEWEGPGWYRRYTYRDYCRGCDMGDTIGLERVDSETVAQWITGDMVERARGLEIRFVPPGLGPKFLYYGYLWRTHSVRVPDRAISIHYAAPEGSSVPSEGVFEAWRVWQADELDLAINEDGCEPWRVDLGRKASP